MFSFGLKLQVMVKLYIRDNTKVHDKAKGAGYFQVHFQFKFTFKVKKKVTVSTTIYDNVKVIVKFHVQGKVFVNVNVKIKA